MKATPPHCYPKRIHSFTDLKNDKNTKELIEIMNIKGKKCDACDGVTQVLRMSQA